MKPGRPPQVTGEVKPCLPRACAKCPWRLSNQGKRSKGGFYTQANLARLWARLRRGEQMTCHPTDPRMVDWGDEFAPPPGASLHECAGSVLLKLRENMRLARLGDEHPEPGEAMKAYRREAPRGLTIEGHFAFVSLRARRSPAASHPESRCRTTLTWATGP